MRSVQSDLLFRTFAVVFCSGICVLIAWEPVNQFWHMLFVLLLSHWNAYRFGQQSMSR